jgi:hypothetical protein
VPFTVKRVRLLGRTGLNAHVCHSGRFRSEPVCGRKLAKSRR